MLLPIFNYLRGFACSSSSDSEGGPEMMLAFSRGMLCESRVVVESAIRYVTCDWPR